MITTTMHWILVALLVIIIIIVILPLILMGIIPRIKLGRTTHYGFLACQKLVMESPEAEFGKHPLINVKLAWLHGFDRLDMLIATVCIL